MDELLGRLEVIQKLLIVLLSDQKYERAILRLQDELYRDYGAKMNKRFPSDPDFQKLQTLEAPLKEALEEIVLNIELSRKFGSEE